VQFETIKFEVADGVAILTFNRPERMNALNVKLKEELAEAFSGPIESDAAMHVVVLTGAGKAFCAGADIKERAQEQLPAAAFYYQQKRTQTLFRSIEESSKVTIAAINGAALGGGLEIALCCDLRLAAADATLGLPEARLGMIPLGGGTQRLPRVIGMARAKELIFTAQTIGAEQAAAIGLVNRTVSAESLMPDALALARRIAAMPPLAVKFAKRAMNSGIQTGIDSALEYELYAGSILNDSEDRQEGMRAFVEKRPATFKGR